MESEGAKEIFLRSMRNNLIYKIFVADGDSGCFSNVKEACYNKYGGSYSIIKEECTGHVQKRMGTRLREYNKKMRGTKPKDGLIVGGKNRLTDKGINKIQNYYGQAIRGNIGDKEGMKKEIWAIFEHCVRDESCFESALCHYIWFDCSNTDTSHPWGKKHVGQKEQIHL